MLSRLLATTLAVSSVVALFATGMHAPAGSVTGVASPPTITEYKIPRANAFPHDPAVGSDGIVWYTDQNNSYIGRLDPATGAITDVATPTPASGPHGIVVAQDLTVWYTAQAAGIIGRLDPRSMKITEFKLPAEASAPHTPLLIGKKVWFTAQTNNTYGELDPATGKVRTFRCPTPRSLPYGMRPAPDGSVWISLFGTNKLGRVDTATGAMQEFVIPDEKARPRRLDVAPNGMVYYSDYARGYLGRLDPRTGRFTEWKSPGGARSFPYGIAHGPDGRIWYDESGMNEMVGFDPGTEQMVTVKIPTAGSVVRNVAVDAKRNVLWLAERDVQRLGKLALGGR